MYCSFCHQEFGSSRAHEHDTKDCPHLKESERHHREREAKEWERVRNLCDDCGGDGQVVDYVIHHDDEWGDDVYYKSCSSCGGSGRKRR